jgi:hypothetical protein
LTLKKVPKLNDVAIFYNKFKSYDSNINTIELKDHFLNDCKIRLNEIEDIFSDSANSNLEVENYSMSDFIGSLEDIFGIDRTDNYHLSFETPFFIQSTPSELKRAPFIQTLYSGDRIKDLLLLSDSNLEELYPNNQVKIPTLKDAKIFLDFIQATNECGLIYERNLVTRFIASLITKPFVILTGLSGSGKTKLAQAFVIWICQKNYNSTSLVFDIGEELISQRVTYKIIQSDKNSVTFTQVDSQVKVTLPYELIYEWIEVIKQNRFDISTPTRSIRDMVGKTTKYSTQLNSFESHLKVASGSK